MNSVPVQFLVYVMANLSCTNEPIFLPLTNCFEVQVGRLVNLSLFVMNNCNRTKSIITEVIDTISITGLTLGNVTNSTTNVSLSYVNLRWTPQANQIGQQQLCTIAYTNEKVQSEEYCVTFIVQAQSDFCQTTTTTTTTTTSTTTTRTTTTTSTSQTTNIAKTTSDPINISLIVGLSLLALLITLCVTFWCFYYYRCSPAKRRQFQRRLTLKNKKGMYEVSDKNMTQPIDASINHVRPLDTSTRDNQTNVLNESVSNEKRPKSKHSTVSVCPVNRLPSVVPSQTENEFNNISLNSASLHKITRQTTPKADHYQSNDDVSTIIQDQNTTITTSTSETKPNKLRRRISNAFSAVLITKIRKPSANNNNTMKSRSGPIQTSIQQFPTKKS